MELSISKVSSDSEFVTRRIRAAVSIYVLDHLAAPTRLECLENMYGGAISAHKSATVIQRCYRNYRLRRSIRQESMCCDSKNCSLLSHGSSIRISCKTSPHYRSKDELSEVKQYQYDPDDPFSLKRNDERKKLFDLGINLFNRDCNKGIKFLINNNILDEDENSIVRFFETKGLSSYAKGDYMSQDNNLLASATRREYISRLSFHNYSIEKGVRTLFAHIRVPGETQKILNMIEEFNSVYLDHNVEFRDKLETPDTVVMIAFAILMLHTSLFNPSAKKQDKMSKTDFVKIFRDYTKDPAIEDNYFDDLYDSIKRQQMKPLSDHTDLVRNIYNSLMGQKVPKNLVQNYRKLICHYQLNEIPNIYKKRNNHNHRRDVYLFNDLVLITKKKDNNFYHVRHCIDLHGIFISEFTTKYYQYSVDIRHIGGSQPLTCLDCIDEETRKKLVVEVTTYVEELKQIDDFLNSD